MKTSLANVAELLFFSTVFAKSYANELRPMNKMMKSFMTNCNPTVRTRDKSVKC